jgi:hypothetical protein
MSDRPKFVRAVLVALGLSLVLLANGLAPVAAQSAETASAPEALIGEALPSADDVVVCDAGIGATDTKADMALHGVTLTDQGALAVGFSRAGLSDELGQRRPAAITSIGDEWTRVRAFGPGAEDGLVAVTAAGGSTAWAVGFTTIGNVTMPLAMRWDGRDWTVDRPRPDGRLASMFTDVMMVERFPFAVGYRMTASGGSQPIAARRDGKRWRYIDPRIGRSESVSLTGVAPDGRGGLWVVGHGGRGTEIGPVIYRRDDARWERQRVPNVRGEGVLTDVMAGGADDGWAVGYQQVDGRSLPLVLHWNGRGWSRAEAPSFDSDEVVLTAVTSSPDAGTWVVGAAWDALTASHEAVAARWDGEEWDEITGFARASELHDAVGALDTDGWAVGRSGFFSLAARVCLPAGPEGNTGRARRVVGDTTAAAGVAGTAATPSEGSVTTEPTTASASTATGTLMGAARTRQQDRKKRSKSQKADRRNQKADRRNQRPRLLALPELRLDEDLYGRDVAARAGIAELTPTYGAVVADFDADGVDDLFIGRHGRPGRLVLNRGGVFEDHEPMRFPPIDRHGCSAADVDGSGLPDLYCTVGGKRGSGLKSNELWLDPAGPAPREAAVELGVSDPTGRGRRASFLQASADDVGLVVTNSPTRVDGLPSIGRLFRTRDGDAFEARPRTGYAARLGSLSTQGADFDGDGREDLLLVTGGAQAPMQEGTRLYRNTPRGLVDVTRRTRIRSFGELDAELVDVDRDGRLDLVQLSETRLRVSELRRGRFHELYDRRLTGGRAVSGGDVNGDGQDDLYLVRSNGTRNLEDVMLVNRGAGRRWSSLPIPQAHTGDGDEAVAIDHDGNGFDDFLVLNGNNARGPIQLIAFYPR